MAEIVRYGQALDFEDYPAGECHPMPHGDYVRYDAHAAEVAKLERQLREARKILDAVHKTLKRGTLHVMTNDRHAAKGFLRMSDMIGEYYGDKPHPDYRPINAPGEEPRHD